MFALSFLQPLLLWGAALASIPLIIHILNKRRYRTVDWAAMEFLLRAFKENRRRIRLEQLLLLLLRMGLVVLLAFLIARPQASAEDFWGLARKVVHHVVILDDSGSMAESSGAGNSFGVARQHILRISRGLAEKRSGDLFTLLRSSSEKPDILGRPVSSVLTSELKDLMQTAQPGPDRLRLDVCLERAKKLATDIENNTEAAAVRLYLVSDLKRMDLFGEEGRIADKIVAKLREFDQEKLRIKVIQCGRETAQNLAVVAVKRKQARSVAGQTSEFEVTVQNQGSQSSDEVELGFSVDGKSRIARNIPPLAPRDRYTETFKAEFTTPGSHWVEADLPKDRLDLDNRRVLAFPVAENARVLLIDGDPGEREELAEIFYAAIALDPDEDGSAGFAVTRIESHQLDETDFTDFDLVVVANLTSVDEETLPRLETYVGEGGGLFLTTGDQVEAQVWNRLFWKDGKALLPAPLKDIGGDLDRPEELEVAAPDHGFFSGHGEEFGELLQFVLTGRYYTLGGQNEGLEGGRLPEETKVLIKVAGLDGAPILLEKPFGKGRVALITTTLDASWNGWQGNPTYPWLLRIAVDYLMRREDLSPMNLTARRIFVKDLPGADYRPDARLLPARADTEGIAERSFVATPVPDQPSLLQIRASPIEGRPWPVAGAYALMLGKIDGGEEPAFFSVSAWEGEGWLAGLDKRSFLTSLPRELAEKTQWLDQSALAQAGFLDDEGEIWRYLAFALLAFLFLETLLAWRFGHR